MKTAAIDAGLVILSLCISIGSSVNEDGLSLLALKSAISADPELCLSSWSETDASPCAWDGVTCDSLDGKVTGISLSGKSLGGYIPSEIGALTYLSSLDLSMNAFSGPLPAEIVTLSYLSHLDLSSNSFTGSIPEGLSKLMRLRGTLNLSYNAFSGEIPGSLGGLPVMLSLDFSHNNLTGKVPEIGSLLNQGPTAFSGNPYLCGFPLNTPCTSPAEAQNPGVPSNTENHRNSGISSGRSKDLAMIIALIFGFSFLVGLISVSTWAVTRKRKTNEIKSGCESDEAVKEERKKGKFVVVDEEFEMGLEDLLRASAYVLGKSKSGIVYKVVVGGGGKGGGASVPVAVRRLGEAEGDDGWRFSEFEAEVEAISRVQHPNIVKLKAYYYSREEKFLVSEFIRNGSLHSALHGTGSSFFPGSLTWATRLRIAQEVAKGLMHIHECSNKKYVHGSITSSKILLDDELKPFIAGFGESRLLHGGSKPTGSAQRKEQVIKINGRSTLMYIAPEARDGNTKLTQKCDVYSFGIVLLELLSGRLPNEGGIGLEGVVREVFHEERRLTEIIDPALLPEIDAKKQVVAVFHSALSCTGADPDSRPRMRTVSETLDCIKLL